MEIIIFALLFMFFLLGVKIVKSKITNNTEINKFQKKSQYLDYLVESNNPDNLFKAANSKYATHTHLVAIAEKCISLDYNEEMLIKITNALANHAESTDSVMQILLKSINPDVWNIVALSNKSRESTLIDVAKKCVSLDCDTKNQIKIASNIIKNPANTDSVMKILVQSKNPDIWILTWKLDSNNWL